MRRIVALFFAVLLSIFLFPAIMGAVKGGEVQHTNISAEDGDAITCGSFSRPFNISVYDTVADRLFEMEFEEYLVGVIAREMPPTYHMEALKAQAVAARSYILSKAVDYFGGNTPEEHRGAMVCTDYTHCKAWKDISEVKSGWDIRFANDYESKIRKAVESTTGEYMIYDNKVVKAYFYAISSGWTENVEEVWGATLPYLKSVPSRGDVGADGYESLSTYTKDLFIQKIKKLNAEAEISDLNECLGEINRTQAGGVAEIEIGGISFKGEAIREAFDLRSTNFKISFDGDKVIFNVKGYGHGVGMSQNGANEMAEEGKRYSEILKHYYSGVDIVNLYKKG